MCGYFLFLHHMDSHSVEKQPEAASVAICSGAIATSAVYPLPHRIMNESTRVKSKGYLRRSDWQRRDNDALVRCIQFSINLFQFLYSCAGNLQVLIECILHPRWVITAESVEVTFRNVPRNIRRASAFSCSHE